MTHDARKPMPNLLLISLLLSSALVSFSVQASKPIIIKHYQQQARYAFGLEVMDLALSKLNRPYEIISPKAHNVNEARGEALVING